MTRLLGGENTLAAVGLDKLGKTDFKGSAAFGSGGQVAPTANVLFRLAVSGFDEKTEQVNSVPENVIFLGDTNVRKEGMETIFPDMNMGTSADGLCHILTKYDMEVVSTAHDAINVGPSDHDWVIADIEDPK